MKPPQHNWSINDSTKEEILNKLRSNKLERIKKDSPYTMKDIKKMFSFLEGDNFSIVENENEFDRFKYYFDDLSLKQHTLDSVDLDEKIYQVKEGNYILGILNIEDKEIIVGINFQPLLGELKFGMAFKIESIGSGLTKKEMEELFKFLDSKNIKRQ